MELFNLYSNFTAEPDTRCKEAKGYCMDASSCPRGNFTDNMCPGDASNKCCLAAPFDEPPCEDAGGRCLDECACTGEVRTGLCGSQPASIRWEGYNNQRSKKKLCRCCIEDELVDDCNEGENEDALPGSSVSADATEENDSLGTGWLQLYCFFVASELPECFLVS